MFENREKTHYLDRSSKKKKFVLFLKAFSELLAEHGYNIKTSGTSVITSMEYSETFDFGGDFTPSYLLKVAKNLGVHRCPMCGKSTLNAVKKGGDYFMQCDKLKDCGYSGPYRQTKKDAIAHNMHLLERLYHDRRKSDRS